MVEISLSGKVMKITFQSEGKCIVEALYNTSCIMNQMTSSKFNRISKKDITECLLDKDAGFG